MYVAVRDAMLRHVNKTDPWAAMKELGVSSVEVDVSRKMETKGFPDDGGKPYNLADAASVAKMKKDFAAHKMSICALLMGNDFSRADLDAEIKWTVDTAKTAKALGVKIVRVDMLPHEKKLTAEEFLPICIGAMQKVIESTRDTGVAFAVENHGAVANKPEFLQTLFDKLPADCFGHTFDTGNFYWWGFTLEEVYGIMERFAPRAKHTHVKNIRYPEDMRNKRREIGCKYGEYVSPIYEGDIDHSKVVAILKKAGYRGPLTVEDESLDKFKGAEQIEVLKKDVAHLAGML